MVDQAFRDSDPSKAVEIVEEHGSFLLVRTASGFAVIRKAEWPDLSDLAERARGRTHDWRGNSDASR